jgi:hypothetical protein
MAIYEENLLKRYFCDGRINKIIQIKHTYPGYEFEKIYSDDKIRIYMNESETEMKYYETSRYNGKKISDFLKSLNFSKICSHYHQNTD